MCIYKNKWKQNMKTISSSIITISLLLAMTMCTLQVNAYHLGRGLRPVNKNRNKDGKAQDKKMYRVYQSHEQQQQHHKVIIRNKLKEMNLLEISKLLLSNNKQTRNNFFFQIPFPWKVLDFFIYKFPNILNILERNTTLQQFLFIRR